jgi:hypothetical protein
MGADIDAATPEEYIAALDEPRRSELQSVHDLVRATLPDLSPQMRSGMIGYGEYHYRYASGREGDSFLVGLASNKRYISLYVLCTIEGRYLAETYADRLPKASIGKSCVRFKRTADVDFDVLRELLVAAGENPPGEMSAL